MIHTVAYAYAKPVIFNQHTMKTVQPHYVRTYRKITALTQGDVSRLLGQTSTVTVCRIEQSSNLPTLETAIALAIILDVPLETLFAGIVQDIQFEVKNRAQAQVKEIDGIKLTTRNFKRKQSLLKIIEPNLINNKKTYEKQQSRSKSKKRKFKSLSN